MQIPLLDLKAQYQSVKNEIDEVVARVIESQYFILSDEVENLEKEIADYSGTSYAAGVASGTDALILSLRALGIGPGDSVITSPFTFFATAEAISILGAKPIFVDIDPGTYNIDPDKIEELLRAPSNEQQATIKALIPVHIYGQCADMDRIMEIAGKYDLKVIEDCAQAIGATYKGKKAGSFGDTGCFSFFPSKNLGGFGDGGMIVANDQNIIERIKKIRVHGSEKQYIHEEIGYNSRLDSLQAAILRIKLRYLDKWFDERRSVAEKYTNALLPLGIVVPEVPEGNVHTYHQYSVRSEDRDVVLKYLNDNGVPSRVYYPVPLHLQPCYKDLGYDAGDLPITESVCKSIFSLPVYPELTDEQINYVVKKIEVCKKTVLNK